MELLVEYNYFELPPAKLFLWPENIVRGNVFLDLIRWTLMLFLEKAVDLQTQSEWHVIIKQVNRSFQSYYFIKKIWQEAFFFLAKSLFYW